MGPAPRKLIGEKGLNLARLPPALAAGVNLDPDPDLPGARRGFLKAWDPVKQEERWRVQVPGNWPSGTMATGGDLVFQGRHRLETDLIPQPVPKYYIYMLAIEFASKVEQVHFQGRLLAVHRRPQANVGNTVEHPAMSEQAEAGADDWGGGAVEFGGECGPQLPDGRQGFGCDRYRMRLLSAREMTGVVSIRVNFRWVEVEATGRWVPEAKWPSAEPRS